MAAARQFIAESGYSEALRTRMQGDASTRSYERLGLGDEASMLRATIATNERIEQRYEQSLGEQDEQRESIL